MNKKTNIFPNNDLVYDRQKKKKIRYVLMFFFLNTINDTKNDYRKLLISVQKSVILEDVIRTPNHLVIVHAHETRITSMLVAVKDVPTGVYKNIISGKNVKIS